MALPIQIVERLARLNVRIGDVQEKFVRGSGPGGQKINKTSSTVWLRHVLTGIEVRCQAERSQAANREKAWEDLCAKLEAMKADARGAEIRKREYDRRRNREKSRGQKLRMIETKKHRARHKASRTHVSRDE